MAEHLAPQAFDQEKYTEFVHTNHLAELWVGMAPRYTYIPGDQPIHKNGKSCIRYGHDWMTGKPVALKFIDLLPTGSTDFSDEDKAYKAFTPFREAMAQAVRHPNIVPVLQILSTKTHAILVMPYLSEDESPPLSKEIVLNVGLMNEERARQGVYSPFVDIPAISTILSNVAGGIDFAHQRGLVHRDIKPQNIFLTRNPVTGKITGAKISDFGAALGVHTPNLGCTIGTPLYMAPEQVMGIYDNKKIDIYALALTVHEMLTGCLPFHDERIFDDQIMSLLSSRVSRRSYYESLADNRALKSLGIDMPGLDAVFWKALVKEPNVRYDTVGEFAQDMELVLSGQPPVYV